MATTKAERNCFALIQDDVAKAIARILGTDEVAFNIPPKREFGDFSTAVCLAQARVQKRAPMQIAEDVKSDLDKVGLPFIKRDHGHPAGIPQLQDRSSALREVRDRPRRERGRGLRQVEYRPRAQDTHRAHQRQPQQGHAHRPPAQCHNRGLGRARDGEAGLHASRRATTSTTRACRSRMWWSRCSIWTSRSMTASRDDMSAIWAKYDATRGRSTTGAGTYIRELLGLTRPMRPSRQGAPRCCTRSRRRIAP